MYIVDPSTNEFIPINYEPDYIILGLDDEGNLITEEVKPRP